MVDIDRAGNALCSSAQQRLVMLTIDLGLASERIEDDPAAAKQLILEGQEQAREALAEIRDLVRGIAPSILVDRGLVPAIESISARGRVPTAIASDLAPGKDASGTSRSSWTPCAGSPAVGRPWTPRSSPS